MEYNLIFETHKTFGEFFRVSLCSAPTIIVASHPPFIVICIRYIPSPRYL